MSLASDLLEAVKVLATVYVSVAVVFAGAAAVFGAIGRAG